MPKEVIYDSGGPYLLTKDGNELDKNSPGVEAALKADPDAKWRQRGVHAGWLKDCHVEIGVASFDPSREMPRDGVFTGLDRAGVNRLIRALRKARDAAFGSDA